MILYPILLRIFGAAQGQGLVNFSVFNPGVLGPLNDLLPQQVIGFQDIDNQHARGEDHHPEDHGLEARGDNNPVEAHWMPQVQGDDERLTDNGHHHGESRQRADAGKDLDPEDIGQDGDHYNQSLSSPANYSAPSEVIEALQIASDHLPVTLKLRINQQTANANTYTLSSKLPSYFGNNIWKLNDLDESEFTNVGIYDITGRYIMTVRCNNEENTVSLNELNKGLYIINYYSNGYNKSYKFVRE